MPTNKGIYCFDTPIGRCGLAWTEKGIDMMQLPGDDPELTEKLLLQRAPDREVTAKPPKKLGAVARRIERHFKGKTEDFTDVALDLSGVSDFAAKVYSALRKVPPGKYVTYAELAEKAGKPKASRGAGAAMAANPIPILIPCHRVVAKSKKLGGFSAPKGPSLKVHMLHIEGVCLNEQDKEAMDHVAKVEPKFKKAISLFGPYLPTVLQAGTAYESLIKTILYQQISYKAAASIEKKFIALFGDGKGNFPAPEFLAQQTPEKLREAGISRQKAGYLLDLAEKTRDGQVQVASLSRMSDEKVIEQLTKIKGIGVWSAQMLLIFQLGRYDVWPVDDLGLQNGAQILLGLNERPTKKEMEKIGDKWRPYRSVACYYLWRIAGAGGI